MTIGILSAALLGVVGQASGPPTVYTLTLDDLLTRHYPGTDQRFKLIAPSGTTGFIEIDDNATIYSASAIASDMQTKLRSLTGYSGKVDVSGASSEAGDKYTFTASFDASLGAVTLEFEAVTSQWHPLITPVETVTQQGATAIAEVVTLTCDTPPSALETVTLSSSGSVNFQSDGTIETGSIVAPTDFSVSSGGEGQAFVEFTALDTGPITDVTIVSQSGDGSYSIAVGAQGANAAVEIHTITPSPRTPTGGTWHPYGLGAAINHNADNTAISDQIGTYFDPDATLNATVSGTLDAGTVTVTAPNVGDLPNTVLSPAGSLLTAPEITHSIA